MTLPLANRLVGLCAFSTLTIASFTLKMIWWNLRLPVPQRSHAVAGMVLVAVLALAATVGSWRQKRWGYALAIPLCARENIMAVHSYYSQPVAFRFDDILGIALAGIPVGVGMIAAIVLLLAPREKVEGI